MTSERRTPSTPAELVELVREAAARKHPLYVEGGATKQHVGPWSTDAGVHVSMGNLAAIIAYEPGDMVVTVQAGMRLEALQRTLAEHGQWLPIDPPFPGATIGGIIATASTGPRRHGYGTAKDLTLGASLVNASAVMTKSGGRVVKNVTGFDLHRLQWGAMGTLAVLVEVSLKVSARPPVRAVFATTAPDLGTLHRHLLDVAGSPLRPVALAAYDGADGVALRSALPGSLPAGAVALVGVEGPRSFIERHARDLPVLAERAGVTPPERLEGDHAERVWNATRGLGDRRAAGIVARVGARPHDLPAILTVCGERAAVDLQAATGVARITLPASLDARAAADLVRRWHATASAREGYACVESAPLAFAGRADLPFRAAPDDLLRSLQLSWDKDRILNRGRMPA